MNPPSFERPGRRRLGVVFSVIVSIAIGFWIGYAWAQRNVLSAMVPILIEEAGIEFLARLDTGATVSSINAVNIEIVGADEQPKRDHVGRIARFMLINANGQQAEVEAPVEEVRGVRTADCRELRYHVYLTVVRGRESYRVLMNLNDRSESREKLLLGRNWLRHGFSVDVSRT